MQRFTALDKLPASVLNAILSETTLSKCTVTYSNGRIATIVDTHSSPNVTYTLSYNGQGLVSSVTNGTTTWAVTYNGANQVTAITQTP